MNLVDLSANQLKRAVAIKERIEALNRELIRLLGESVNTGATSVKSRTMSASATKKIAASQKARWAKLRRAKSATRSTKPAGTAPKAGTSASANARRSAKLKAYWAAKKKAGKK
jgi:hypothetical protein